MFLTVFRKKNQNITASNLKSGDFKHFVNKYRGGSNTTLEIETNGSKKVVLNKDNNGVVESIQIGDYTYVGDAFPMSNFVRFFQSEGSQWNLFVIKDRIVLFRYQGSINGIKIQGGLGGKPKKIG